MSLSCRGCCVPDLGQRVIVSQIFFEDSLKEALAAWHCVIMWRIFAWAVRPSVQLQAAASRKDVRFVIPC